MFFQFIFITAQKKATNAAPYLTSLIAPLRFTIRIPYRKNTLSTLYLALNSLMM